MNMKYIIYDILYLKAVNYLCFFASIQDAIIACPVHRYIIVFSNVHDTNNISNTIWTGNSIKIVIKEMNNKVC